MKFIRTFFHAIILIWWFEASTALSGPLEQTDHPHKDSVTAVHDAAHDVDHTWEIYHRAALGGTVASPRLQAEIEEHLHDARTLITQAQKLPGAETKITSTASSSQDGSYDPSY
ncbi:MAG: hypothetical protein MRJ68_00600 [Nitrospira sp.]|nr:hypothetical protein [Nitrospira sp.]